MTNVLIVTDIYGKQHKVSVGTEVFVHCHRNRGGHGAWIEVTKINKKSFKGIEAKGSYTPGTNWSIHVDAKFAIVERPEGRVLMRHWINDI